MLLAGQGLTGNQAVAAAAGALPTAQQQQTRKPEPGKQQKPGRKAKVPLRPRRARKDTKGTEDRRGKGAKREAAEGTRSQVVADRSAGPVVGVHADNLAGQQRLSLPLFARRFDARATLPPMGTKAAERDAVTAAERAFARIVERARRAHNAQLALLQRIGRSALDRHNRVDLRAQSRVAQALAELDDLRGQALATVDNACEEGLAGLDLAVRRGRRLIAAASAGALRRVRANADTAEAQITTILNDLAADYTTLFEQSAVAITSAAGPSIQAVQGFSASAATLFPGGETPLVEAENESRRGAVPRLAAEAEQQMRDASEAQAKLYRDQIDVVRQKFNQSELATQLQTRKSEIVSKGLVAVEKATRTAYSALSEQAASGRKTIRRMAADTRESIEARHKAARSRLISDANGLSHASHAQTSAELDGLETAATTGLPAFESMITSVRDGLKHAATVSADSLRLSAERAAEDTGPRVDQLGVTQQRMVTRADASTARSVDEAERSAIRASGRARAETARALREAGKGGARGINDFVHGHDASFAATARGVRQVADAWAMPLAKVFGDAVSKTKTAGAVPFEATKEATVGDRNTFVSTVFTPRLNPAAALRDGLDKAAKEMVAKLVGRRGSLVKAISGAGTDEKGVSDALRGMTPTQGRALSWMWEQKFHHTLDSDLVGDLSGSELDSARAYVRGDQVKGAAAELDAAIGWFNDDEARIESTMRNLTPEELGQLKGSKEGAEALADVRDSLGGTDLKVFDALAAGNQDLADAFRMKDKIDTARQSVDADAIHDALIEYSKAPTERGRAEVSADARRVAVQREFAGIVGGTERGAAPISPEQAAAAVEKYALAPIKVVTADPHGGQRVETKEITGANRDLAVALIRGGENTVEARAARLGVETQRPGGPNMLKVDAALYDPRLKPLPANLTEAERARAQVVQNEALAERNQVIQKYAASYGGADKAGTPASAKSFLEGRLRGAYGDDKDAGELAARLVQEDYPTPKTAALAVKYASKGAGTNEELMFRITERMDRDEIAAMRGEYKALTGNELDDDLGTFGGKGLFTELSGDERLRMEVALLGVPRNDKEAAEVAAFRMQQQRDETGGLGSWLAGGSLADQYLASTQADLTASLGGATIRVDSKGNPVWSDAAGRPMDTGGTLFDEKGKYAGKDPREFAIAVQESKLAAEAYAAQIDSFASMLTTAVMVIGAVAAAVATVATGGAASPLLIAAIAGVTGLGSMAVHSAVSGGRYGWEQASVDLGMTAVQALTAGVGQHLSMVARGGAQSLTAGMTTLQSAKNLSGTLGSITGSALGDLAVIGAATGGMGGFGGALLDEVTWSKGLGHGFAALLEGTLTGALAGAASSVASQALESLPVGRAVAGGPRATLGDALSDSLPGRAGLRVASSFLGGAVGGGVQVGAGALTGSFRGDAGDVLAAMGEAGLQAAVEESAAGSVEGPVQRARQARNLPGPDTSRRSPVDDLVRASGTASAVDSRFRGDAVEPTATNTRDVQRQIEVDTPAHLVGRGARQFDGQVHSEPAPPPVRITLDRANAPSIDVEIAVTPTHPATPDGVPVARYQRVQDSDGNTYYRVEVSAGADPRYVERALAHEFAEIRHHTTDAPDVLRHGSDASELSPHDRGRLAEFEVIARQLENMAPDAPEHAADIARLIEDAASLAEHLGLVGRTDEPGQAGRRGIALVELETGSRAHKLLGAILENADSGPAPEPDTRTPADKIADNDRDFIEENYYKYRDSPEEWRVRPGKANSPNPPPQIDIVNGRPRLKGDAPPVERPGYEPPRHGTDYKHHRETLPRTSDENLGKPKDWRDVDYQHLDRLAQAREQARAAHAKQTAPEGSVEWKATFNEANKAAERLGEAAGEHAIRDQVFREFHGRFPDQEPMLRPHPNAPEGSQHFQVVAKDGTVLGSITPHHSVAGQPGSNRFDQIWEVDYGTGKPHFIIHEAKGPGAGADSGAPSRQLAEEGRRVGQGTPDYFEDIVNRELFKENPALAGKLLTAMSEGRLNYVKVRALVDDSSSPHSHTGYDYKPYAGYDYRRPFASNNQGEETGR